MGWDRVAKYEDRSQVGQREAATVYAGDRAWWPGLGQWGKRGKRGRDGRENGNARPVQEVRLASALERGPTSLLPPLPQAHAVVFSCRQDLIYPQRTATSYRTPVIYAHIHTLSGLSGVPPQCISSRNLRGDPIYIPCRCHQLR